MRVLTKRQKILTIAGVQLLAFNNFILFVSFIETDNAYLLYVYLPVCMIVGGYAIGKVIWIFRGDKEEKHPVEE